MKKLKANQNHGCDYCRESGTKTKAIYRGSGISGKNACEGHVLRIQEDEKTDDGHLTEADYQTWMRL